MFYFFTIVFLSEIKFLIFLDVKNISNNWGYLMSISDKAEKAFYYSVQMHCFTFSLMYFFV